MNLLIKNLSQVLNAKFIGSTSTSTIDHVSIDSRSLQHNTNTLFFALVGSNNDGHKYISELIEKGVLNFVVTHVPEELSEKANFLVVENTLDALQQFAAHHRNQYKLPIIGLTGSNGKTIVKEWLNFLLSPDFNIVRSPKSYNSQVGVPLSVISINDKHNFGIFEAGISKVNEMEKLESIIKPTIGVLTSIGSAHDEGFANTEEKIKEKLKLFKDSEVLIYQKNKDVDDVLSHFHSQSLRGVARYEAKQSFGVPIAIGRGEVFSWSFNDKAADVYIEKNVIDGKTLLQINHNTANFVLEIPFQDEASIENAVSCTMVLLYLKYDIQTIQDRVSGLFPVEMRLKVKNGINNTTLIDDSYSSDFQSLKIALDFLEIQKQHENKTIILSDIFESGLNNQELYSKVSQLIVSNNISRVILVGAIISTFKNLFSNYITFENTDDLIYSFERLNFSNETILIKGARNFLFEKIVALLEEQTHETVLEINLNAISHNLNFYKSKLKPSTKMMVMVKAFGYGNGGFEIAKLLEHHKVDYLGVAFADEGMALKSAGIKLPIMVLNPESTSFPAIIQFQLEPEIYTLKGLNSFLKIAKLRKLENFPIHIKLDTGMHRLGFEEEHLDELISILKMNNSVCVKSILSHLATSDDVENSDFCIYQINLFEKMSSKLIRELQINTIRHILNTSGISNYPESQYDMVRLGIGIYGVSNSDEEQKELQNVSTLKSIVSQIRTIQVGESVGYGRRFVAQKPTQIATIPIGYADGIARLWGNGVGFVTINNQKATIVGSICMDMLMVDSTGIDCKEGDVVIIFGESPTVSEIAQKINTIPYEVLTSISQRVKRVFYRE